MAESKESTQNLAQDDQVSPREPAPVAPLTLFEPLQPPRAIVQTTISDPPSSEEPQAVDLAASPVEPHASSTIEMAPLYVDPAKDSTAPNVSAETPQTTKQGRSWKDTAQKAAAVARQGALAFALVAAICIFLQQVNQHYPIKHWLFWMYAKIWGYCSLFILAVASSGHLVVNALGGKRLPLGERTTLSLASGTLVFFTALFICGLFGIYGRAFAIVFPIVLFLPGSVSLFRHARRSIHHLRGAMKRTTWRPSLLHWAIGAYGLMGVGMIYFAIMSPRNIAYDSYFYHLGIAQQYATDKGIRPFLEGWFPGAIPHLASVLYTWALLLPGLTLFERITCAAHVEFVLFLFTLVGVPVLVRKLVPKAPAGLSWAAFFLFPEILVYDSALSAAADHVNAFWAVPIFLMLLRSLRSLRPDSSTTWTAVRDMSLLSAFLSGALLTKYQGMYLVAFPLLAIVVVIFGNLGKVLIRRRDLFFSTFRKSVAGGVFATLVGLILTAPHWLKNWVWYGDPFFPYLNRYMLSSKWVPETGALFDGWNSMHNGWRPAEGTLLHKLAETAQAMVAFSFQPHDWIKFHGHIPIFGSLFTLSALMLLFLRNTRRIWIVFIATEIGIAVWYWTLHQDRYLQALVPWMVCVVAATLALLWQKHWTMKTLTCILVGVQIVWGGDAYFIPAHAMTGTSAAPVTVELLSQGMKGKYTERFAYGDRLFEIGRDPLLPDNAKVLLHEHEPRLGIWRPVVSDLPGIIFGHRFEMLPTPAAVDAQLRKYGVTHVITRFQQSRMNDSIGSDLQFFAFIEFDAKLLKKFTDWALYAMPTSPPTRTSNNVVAYLGCGAQYERGLHKLSSMTVRDRHGKRPPKIAAMTPAPLPGPGFAQFMAQADFAVTDAKCKPAAPTEATLGFVQIAVHDSETLWARPRR